MIDQQLKDDLRRARHVMVLTGAGVSAESGIPTFRDRLTGLWANFDATALATPEAFARDPSFVWGEPNAAHRGIAALAGKVSELTLVTQNVDDLHERAGSADVVHLHGRLLQPYCEGCREPYRFPDKTSGASDAGGRVDPPNCSACGGRVRPGVVWFGEALPQAPWQTALRAAQQCDVLLCVGTSAVVQPAASLIEIAHRAGAVTVQINPNATEADRVVTHSLRGPAGLILPQLVGEVWGANR
jgi:NAD-dependent deacetylase